MDFNIFCTGFSTGKVAPSLPKNHPWDTEKKIDGNGDKKSIDNYPTKRKKRIKRWEKKKREAERRRKRKAMKQTRNGKMLHKRNRITNIRPLHSINNQNENCWTENTIVTEEAQAITIFKRILCRRAHKTRMYPKTLTPPPIYTTGLYFHQTTNI